MSKWRECRIGKVVTLRQGLCINSKTKHLLANEGHVLLRITDLINGTEIQYIDEKIPKKFLATKNDLIYSRTGQVGLVFKGREGVVYNNCFTVSPNEEIDSDYLYWFLKTKFAYDYANGVASGAAQLDLNHDSFRSMYIRYPEKMVQQQIAEILTAYDDLIETNNQRIATLEAIAQQIYKEWFVRLRFPGWEHTPFHHGIPEGWEEIPFGEIAKEVKRHIKLKDLKPDSIYVGLEHLPVKSIALQNWDSVESINSDKLLFNKNDILFCKIRPYLHKVALAPVNGSCSSDTIVIKAAEQQFLPYVLQIAFSETFIDYASVTSKGTKMPRADWGVLKKFPIFKPSDELLESFNKISLPILEQIHLLSEMNCAYTKTRNLLLPRLISGKLTLKQATQPTDNNPKSL